MQLIVVEGSTKGYAKQVSESDGTVSDAAADPPPPADDHGDAVIHTSASTDSLNIDRLIHEKADVLVARSTVSGSRLFRLALVI